MVVATSAVFAVVLFTQTFPSVTRPAPAITSNCTTLVVKGVIPAVGTSDFLRFDCGGGLAAFSVPTFSSAIPTFTLPTGYTSLMVVPVENACLQFPTGLTSGSAYSFSAGSFDYCALLDTNTLELATFDITWDSIA